MSIHLLYGMMRNAVGIDRCVVEEGEEQKGRIERPAKGEEWEERQYPYLSTIGCT